MKNNSPKSGTLTETANVAHGTSCARAIRESSETRSHADTHFAFATADFDGISTTGVLTAWPGGTYGGAGGPAAPSDRVKW